MQELSIYRTLEQDKRPSLQVKILECPVMSAATDEHYFTILHCDQHSHMDSFKSSVMNFTLQSWDNTQHTH